MTSPERRTRPPTEVHDGLPDRHVLRAISHPGLHAFEALYAPHTRLTEHEHAAPFFTYVLRGSYVECVEGESRRCVRGAMVFHPPFEVHANLVGETGTASLNVEIAQELWSELSEAAPGDTAHAGVLSGDLEWCAMRVWREFHRDDAASVVGLEEAMATLCGRLRHQDLPTRYVASRRLATCLEFLSARLETPPRLSEVARISGVHPMHLARLFRQRFGYSMGEYVRRSRIAWACDLLQQDGRTIGETAIRVGFADHAHFTRTFVRVTGCTPRWYRSRVLQSRVFRRF